MSLLKNEEIVMEIDEKINEIIQQAKEEGAYTEDLRRLYNYKRILSD